MSTKLDKNGHEILDQTPIAVPVGFGPSETLAEQIRRILRQETFRQELASQGVETFEEADDFEVGDDYDPKSPYEEDFEPAVPATPVSPAESSNAQPGPQATSNGEPELLSKETEK